MANSAESSPSSVPEGATAVDPSSKVLDRVVQGAHETIDRLAERAAPHAQRIEEGVNVASEKLHVKADQVREMGDEWAESLRGTVRENPLTALAAALAIGVLIARLTR